MKQIQLEHITKRFGDHVIIKDFNYVFESGKIIAVTGESGSGKSTLLNMIGLMELPTEGKIQYDTYGEVTMRKRNAIKLLRNEISYIFQNYALLEDETVYQNMCLAMEYHAVKNKKEYIIKKLAEVGLDQAYVTKKIYELSGGEQQRVAIARALSKPCSLILADEPTGNLDKVNAAEVFSILKRVSREGKCVILVTHDKELAEQCDEVIQLNKLK